MSAIVVKVEDKLFQNRYRVDAGRPHIKIKSPTSAPTSVSKSPAPTCARPVATTKKAMARSPSSPTAAWNAAAAAVICSKFSNVDWEYPRGGHGILFKFG